MPKLPFHWYHLAMVLGFLLAVYGLTQGLVPIADCGSVFGPADFTGDGCDALIAQQKASAIPALVAGAVGVIAGVAGLYTAHQQLEHDLDRD